jgi:clan AA aspartic protease (TIGR02281 family)
MKRQPAVRAWRAAACLLALAGALSGPNAGATEKCRLAKVGSIPLAWDGLQPHVEGSINGTPVSMTIDTGSDDMTLMGGMARRLGLSLSVLNMETMGVGGNARTFRAHASEVSIGKAQWHNVNLFAVEDARSDGVIVGARFLLKLDLEMKDGELAFYEATNCKDAWLGYWGDDVTAAPMERVASDDDRVAVQVRVNGQPLRALVDTGAEVSIIDLKAARKLGFDPATAKKARTELVGFGTRALAGWEARFDTFEIGDETVRHPHLQVHDLYGHAREDSTSGRELGQINRQPEMILGADFLKSHHVLFAVHQEKMYFSYVGGNLFNAPTAVEAPAAAASLPAAASAAAGR